jgi:hypothetical protein
VCLVPYLPSALLLIVGLLVLGMLMRAALRSLRRFAASRAALGSQVSDQTGLLRARSAALRIAVVERRRRPVGAPTPAVVAPSTLSGRPPPRSMRQRGRRQEDRGGG